MLADWVSSDAKIAICSANHSHIYTDSKKRTAWWQLHDAMAVRWTQSMSVYSCKLSTGCVKASLGTMRDCCLQMNEGIRPAQGHA